MQACNCRGFGPAPGYFLPLYPNSPALACLHIARSACCANSATQDVMVVIAMPTVSLHVLVIVVNAQATSNVEVRQLESLCVDLCNEVTHDGCCVLKDVDLGDGAAQVAVNTYKLNHRLSLDGSKEPLQGRGGGGGQRHAKGQSVHRDGMQMLMTPPMMSCHLPRQIQVCYVNQKREWWQWVLCQISQSTLWFSYCQVSD